LPSGRRPDAVNFETKQVLELKPNNRRAVRRGEGQLQRYVEELNREYGRGWTGTVVRY
jgi:RecB family endonuclease NucS